MVMAALTGIVVALSVAVAANFALLLAIVRRMRLQREAPSPIDVPRLGMQAPSFTVLDLTGQTVDDSFYSEHGEAVVAFLSDDCQPCERVKAELVRDPIADPLLAFVQTIDGGTEQAEFATALARAGARTVLLEQGSDIPKRFSVSAFPTLLRLHDGVVVGSSIKLADIRDPVASANDTIRQQGSHLSSKKSASADNLIRR